MAQTVWIPNSESIKKTNLAHFMTECHFNNLKDFHRWTVKHYVDFWDKIIRKLSIRFKIPYQKICDLSEGIEKPRWLVGAKMNIAESCFTSEPEKIALIFQDEKKEIKKLSYGELNRLSNRVANSLVAMGFSSSDRIGIDMPMTVNAVAIYLGIIKMGGVVVSIADSFSADEIKTRLLISEAKAVFTQDFIRWGKKILPSYEKVINAHAPLAIVLPSSQKINSELRRGDMTWSDFLGDQDQFDPVSLNPMSHCNILFSSGTTGTPKAIPWNHTTPIKVASDAYFHQDVQPNDILTWPTNLGWMMGPWLIFAALINQASIALFPDLPTERDFGEFIQNAKVTQLGVIPSLVAKWRNQRCMKGCNWEHIKLFSSTGECSNEEDMAYLMSLAKHKPVIEYCGGTEIGGAYITSTLCEKNYPSCFTTPAMGIDFVLLNESGELSDQGEVAIIPPSIGLSTELLNADHHQIYFANMPTLPEGKKCRRHGDAIKKIAPNRFSIIGRVDDTMNLGGIKIGSAEIERVLSHIENIEEVAAVASHPKHKGPSELVIFAATKVLLDKNRVMQEMQARINHHLNPLFKIKDIIFVESLPKTASNKLIRRILREKINSL